MQNGWTVVYYHNARGDEVVKQEILAFGKAATLKIVSTIDLLEDYGLNIRTSYAKHIGGKIWELRIDRYRVLYFTLTGRRFVMLRAFVKKTKKTPAAEIFIAQNRLHEYIQRWREENDAEG